MSYRKIQNAKASRGVTRLKRKPSWPKGAVSAVNLDRGETWTFHGVAKKGTP